MLDLLKSRASTKPFEYSMAPGVKNNVRKVVHLTPPSLVPGTELNFRLPRHDFLHAVFLRLTLRASELYYDSAEATIGGLPTTGAEPTNPNPDDDDYRTQHTVGARAFALFEYAHLMSKGLIIESLTNLKCYIYARESAIMEGHSGNHNKGWNALLPQVLGEYGARYINRDLLHQNSLVTCLIKLPFSFIGGRDGTQNKMAQSLQFLEDLEVRVKLPDKKPGENPLFTDKTYDPDHGYRGNDVDLVRLTENDVQGRQVPGTGLTLILTSFNPKDTQQLNDVRYKGEGPTTMLCANIYNEETQVHEIPTYAGASRYGAQVMKVPIKCQNVCTRTYLVLRNETPVRAGYPNFGVFDSFLEIDKVVVNVSGRALMTFQRDQMLALNLIAADNMEEARVNSVDRERGYTIIEWGLWQDVLDRHSGSVSWRNLSNPELEVHFTIERRLTYDQHHRVHKLYTFHDVYNVAAIDPATGVISTMLTI
ncbi:MAG: hypothetical protein CMF51_05715 [Legionellales bacterium]|nr:hypothetical protein [Legionellales bacterium]